MMPESFLDDIYHHAAGGRARPALLEPGREPVCFGTLCDRARAMAGALAEAGLKRGDVIAAALPGNAEVLGACLGVAGLGAFAPLNPALPEAEQEYFLSRLHPAALISPADSPAAIAARALGVRVLPMQSLTGAAAADFPPPSGSDPAIFLHTSATTGRPKLVCHTHATFVAMSRAGIESLGQTSADLLLCMMPMFHLQGLKAALNQFMAGGSVLLANSSEVARFPEWLIQYRPTWFTAGATLHRAILSSLRNSGVPARGYLRMIRNMGTALPPTLEAELEETFGAPVLNGYGLTETGAVTSSPLPPGKRKSGSAGIASGAEVAVLDESGNIVVKGGEGEIVVRGPGVAHGYWDDPEATRVVFRDGWFHTGDLGRIDSEGYLYVTGRIKEMINKGGEKILPGQIDEALMAHPRVSEAVSFAAPHPTLGEDVAAAVVLRPGAALKAYELRRFAAARLAQFKVPRQILFVDAIPKSATGKPQRHALAALAERPKAQPGDFTRHREAELAACWSRFLAGREFGATDDFFELGGDSLSARMMLVEVQDKFGELNEGEFLIDPTIATLAALIESGDSRERDARPLFALQPYGSRPPFFCIPGAGEDPFYMRLLARRIGAGQPFYVLRDPRPAATRGEQAVETTAAWFAEAAHKAQPEGPLLIGGHCYGGVVAFEMAQRLSAAGRKVALLVMFDAPTPGYPKLLRSWKRYGKAIPRLTPGAVAEHARFLCRLGQRRLASLLPAAQAPTQAETNAFATRRYSPRPFNGKVFTFLAGGERQSTLVLDDSRLGWRDFARGGFETRTVPGTHMSMFAEPHVAKLAEQLEALLSAASTAAPTAYHER